MPRRPAKPVYAPLPRFRQRLPFKHPVRQRSLLDLAVWVALTAAVAAVSWAARR